MSRRTQTAFHAVTTEGGILPQELLERVRTGDKDLPGLDNASYHLGKNERVGEVVNHAWSRLLSAWKGFQEALAKLPEGDLAIGVTREKWLLPLFRALDYGWLERAGVLESEGKQFAISHTYRNSPVHLMGWGMPIDKRTKGTPGAAKASPHGLVQEFLNRSDDHLWGFVSNGRVLRILRDNYSLTRQAYVEFDLERIMEGEYFAEFRLLWLVCHQSRADADKPEECWLEKWFQQSKQQGVRALDKLRAGVEQAIATLGAGFLKHRANTALHERLGSGELDAQDYYRQLLRLVYRLIFLFVAEDREVLLEPKATDEAKGRYLRFYSTQALRDLALRRRGGPHGDRWQALKLVMRGFSDGLPELGLPALGSFLWEEDSLPDLMAAELANVDLFGALRSLGTTKEGKQAAVVNWRNIGAEELGSIYESLLELHPELNKEAGTFKLEVAAGHERKTTGSYYTPTALVDCLLDSALDPVLDEAAAKPDPETAILNLKVCDPACGSGHFLVAAARRVAKRLAAVRSGDEEPSPGEIQHALREVVGRCVYGVDINPMAVELCNVSLWMEAVEPGKPLSFLDSHIQCGNALLGATPALMARGIPDEAFKPIEGDVKKVASALRKRNKSERQAIEAGQSTMFDAFDRVASRDVASVAEKARAVEGAADAHISDLRDKERSWGNLTRSPEFKDAWFRADMWCSAFFWIKQPGDLQGGAITQDLWRRIQSDITSAPQATRKAVHDLARQYRYLHWHLAFPTVFGAVEANIDDDDLTGWTGGFDVMLGNPPWDALSPDAKEFFSQYEPEIRFADRVTQKAIMGRLMEDVRIAEKWESYRRELYASVLFMKSSGRYSLYSPGNLGKGDFNVYRMFVETALRTIRDGGRAAQIVPDGLYNGANCMAIRKELFEHCVFDGFLGFENNRQVWFDGIDGRAKFTIYSARHPGKTSVFRAAFNIRSLAQLAEVQAGAALRMPVALVETFSPDALAVMEFESQRDIDIATKMYNRHPKFGDETAGPPLRHYMREIDMGNDRALFREDPTGVPLYEGRMVAQYDYRAKGYRSGRGRKAEWEDLPFSCSTKSIQPQWRVMRDMVPNKCRKNLGLFRIGYCRIASPTNERSLVSCLLPPMTLAGDSVFVITFDDVAGWPYLVWLAVANSFVMDFLARKKVSLNMTYTLMDSMPFPRFTQDDDAVQYLVPRVLRLVCAGPEMVPFCNDMAAGGWVAKHKSKSAVPGSTNKEERREIQAEIDAYVARNVYGMTRDELAYVLDMFPIVEKRDTKEFGEYLTKRIVLEAFDALD